MATHAENEFDTRLGSIRADIAALSKAVGGLAAEAGKTQAALARSMTHAASDAGANAMRLGLGTAKGGVAVVERQILRNPLLAILVASGIGILIGLYNSHR